MNAQTQGSQFSIRETFAGRHIMLVGGSGFVGKVWLAMVLQRIPDVGRIYVLLRGKGRSADERFEKMVNEGYVFRTLHETLGDKTSEYISRRVEVIGGDVSLPDLGIDPETARRLHGKLDLVVNFAGLVDFNPDLRLAAGTNVDGGVHVANFAQSCDHARLVHISTCYVAGMRDGFVREQVEPNRSPNGTEISAHEEYENMRRIIERTEAENESAETEAHLHKDVIARLSERGYEANERRIRDMVGRLKRKRLREMMSLAGTERAKELGWPNTYTYTKALAEMLLSERADELPLTIFRPAIVESAIEYPFPGWNEGFNTSGPLVYLAQTWFRHVPAKAGNPLDVIPVDEVCKALLIASAALLRGEHAPVYQCGSSDRNFLPIDRLTELSALGHRRHLRDHGEGAIEQLVLSRWDARAEEPEHILKIGNIRRVIKQVNRYLTHGLPEKLPSEVRDAADDLAKTTGSANRKLRQIEEVLDLFQPFTHDNFLVFECRAVDRHDVAEPEFHFRVEDIDWRRYWLDVHMPGLRRWCFPQYENKDKEIYEPAHPFRMIDVPEETAAAANDTGT